MQVLVSGVAVAIYEGGSSADGTWGGIVLCVLGTLSNGLMMASIGRLLSEKLDVWRLAFYCAPLTVIMLLPFYWAMEADSLSQYRTENSSQYIGKVPGRGTHWVRMLAS